MQTSRREADVLALRHFVSFVAHCSRDTYAPGTPQSLKFRVYLPKGDGLKKYRRIEVRAYRRRVTVVSGEWRPDEDFDSHSSETEDGVSLTDGEECEPVEPDSPEGQLILAEALRTLELRLSPEARATIYSDQELTDPNHGNLKGILRKLQSFYQLICLRALRFDQKEK